MTALFLQTRRYLPRIARLIPVLMIAGTGASCFLGLLPNSLDSDNPQGLMNALLVQTEAATDAAAGITLGGTVTGLSGSGLVLQDSDNGEVLAISADGSFTFPGTYDNGSSYTVIVSAQPTGPHQTCAVTAGTGTIEGLSVTSIAVNCVTNTYTVGGTVTGLGGTGLTLQNNGGDDLAIAANGAFTFATTVASGAVYSVTVSVQPSGPTQTCNVSGGSGTIVAGNITGVTVNCATNTYTIGGTVAGLSGTGLVLQNNGGDNLAIGANGSFSFATAVNSGAGYNVTILTQPTGPHQTCNVTSGTGTVAASNITGITINCTTNQYTIGGTVSGFGGGTGLVLQNNGGDNLAIGANGGFSFATSIISGGTFNVSILGQPSGPTQTCNVSGGTGAVVGSNITSVSINCTTNTYMVSGTVSGNAGTGLVLKNNGGDNLAVSGNGGFSFATSVASGSPYNVTVHAHPTTPWQTCNITNGAGTIGAANVTNVTVNCVTNTYSVGGTVSGLAGTGLVLRNNGGDNLAIGANGGFTFAPAYGSLAAYNITVGTQPSGPPQICSVSSGSGTITSSNITNVNVTCVTQHTIGGSISGLTAPGLALGLTGGALEALPVANGSTSYQFGSVIANGGAYNVSINTQPGGGLFCTLFTSSGTVAGANVTNLDIACETAPAANVTAGGSEIRNVNLNGMGRVATVGAGANIAVNLEYAVESVGTNVSPVIIGIAGNPGLGNYQAFCNIGTYPNGGGQVFAPGNGNLTAPTQSGVYFIRAYNAWDFCPNMSANMTTHGTTVGIITVP